MYLLFFFGGDARWRVFFPHVVAVIENIQQWQKARPSGCIVDFGRAC